MPNHKTILQEIATCFELLQNFVTRETLAHYRQYPDWTFHDAKSFKRGGNKYSGAAYAVALDTAERHGWTLIATGPNGQAFVRPSDIEAHARAALAKTLPGELITKLPEAIQSALADPEGMIDADALATIRDRARVAAHARETAALLDETGNGGQDAGKRTKATKRSRVGKPLKDAVLSILKTEKDPICATDLILKLDKALLSGCSQNDKVKRVSDAVSELRKDGSEISKSPYKLSRKRRKK